MGLLFGYFLAFIFITIGLFFSLMAYTQKKAIFFYLALGFIVLTTVSLVMDFEYLYYALNTGDIFTIGITIAWVTSIVFLILSKTTTNKSDENVADAFLDEIINSEDEEWDPES